ncbi:MAG: ribosome maturation factor RimM [Methylobacteriaceae bacterium]|nr:ribosome maturation factor RimM [Methylobacteriaceae bacterium]
MRRGGRPRGPVSRPPASPAARAPRPPTPTIGRDPPPGHVLLGEIGRAHGLRGEVRLRAFTADPLAIASYGPFLAGDGRSLAIEAVRHAPGDAADMLVARLADVTTREAAEALNRLALFVPRERLGDTAEEDEFFLADLIGLTVEDEAGEPQGRVAAVPNYGGGDLLEIAPADGSGAARLLPFTKACVPLVDVAGKRIVVRFPAETEAKPDSPEA